MTTLSDLKERVDRATGADRGLDGAIEVAFPSQSPAPLNSDAIGWVRGPDTIYLAPPYTASIDEALVLVQRVIPDVFWLIGRGTTRAEEPLFGVKLMFAYGLDTDALGLAEHDHAPLAILSALLAAKIAEADNGD